MATASPFWILTKKLRISRFRPAWSSRATQRSTSSKPPVLGLITRTEFRRGWEGSGWETPRSRRSRRR